LSQLFDSYCTAGRQNNTAVMKMVPRFSDEDQNDSIANGCVHVTSQARNTRRLGLQRLSVWTSLKT